MLKLKNMYYNSLIAKIKGQIMQLRVKSNPTNTEIHIDNNIKSLGDNDVIKHAIENAWNDDETKHIDIFINDSFIITSSVIGFLIKCIKKDKMKISLKIYNEELYEMLDDMNLVHALNVRKV